MKIVIPAGSGQVGGVRGRAFAADGHEVVVLSRNPTRSPGRVVPCRKGTSGSADDI